MTRSLEMVEEFEGRHRAKRVPNLEVPYVRYLIGWIAKTFDYINRDNLTLPLSVYEVSRPLTPERSARSTFPELKGFRVAALRGFRRVFAHAAPIFFERGIAIEATKASRLYAYLYDALEFSSLSVEHCEGEMIVVTVFEIKEEEVPAFIERELEFRFLAVAPEGLDGAPFPNPAVVCARYSDEEYFQVRCKG
ncbi:hypothetical protein TRIUR3_18079 [Triticum urartu]|uniref:Uncharacterized protein n=1 Tax=Triticum urartu TaxID=4572 RepID=M8AU29_TRIUA|nr:hypothetical protein TRIUR3_18079 [Triticum urartu]